MKLRMEERREGLCKEPEAKSVAWYCVRSRRKQEHLAAAHVRVLGNVAVFCPRIRFRRPSRRGPVCVTEALFPGYFFARFSLQEMLPWVRSAHGVTNIVRFGEFYPAVSDNIIDDLRTEIEGEDVRQTVPELVAGDRVRLLEGPLAGLEAVITEVLPGNERVRLLLEFLGRDTVVEANAENVVAGEDLGPSVFRFATRLVPIERARPIRRRKVSRVSRAALDK